MIIEKQHLTVSHTPVLIFRIEGLVKCGESAEFFLWNFEEAAVWNDHAVVDLEKIDYIDSTGIGEFVAACVILARVGRNLVLSKPSERVMRLIRTAKASEDIRVFGDVEEAIAAVAASTPREGPIPRFTEASTCGGEDENTGAQEAKK
jgi:anti-anti-sigma factor